MNRYSDRKIVIVKRTSRLEDMIKRFNTIEQAKFYINSLGGDFDDYVQEDKQYSSSLQKVYQGLDLLGKIQVIDREFLTNFIFGPEDIVVAVGQDGMVANVLKYLDNHPLIGVNPDSQRYDGVLLPFNAYDCTAIVKDVIDSKYRINEVTMAKVSLNDGQVLYAVNDFFVGHQGHVSFRYAISQNDYTEKQSSSGIIISTGLGSTGWMKSILTGASSIINQLTGANYDFTKDQDKSWDQERLTYSVREPFTSKYTSANLAFGFIEKGNELYIQSQSGENCVIFSDGIASDFLEFNAGLTATFGVADKKGLLVY